MDKEVEDYLSFKLLLIRGDIEQLLQHSLYAKLADGSKEFLCDLIGEIEKGFIATAKSRRDIDIIPQDVLEEYVVSRYLLQKMEE
jgi:hypothetical protein